MKKITLRIDDETSRKVLLRAAEEGKSVISMVNDFLPKQAGDQDDRDTHRIAALDQLYLIADARGQARANPLKPMTRDETYADNLGQNQTQE
ncbi:MAG: hypothetical protein ABIT37_25145 [Luteolibacter sp.]